MAQKIEFEVRPDSVVRAIELIRKQGFSQKSECVCVSASDPFSMVSKNLYMISYVFAEHILCQVRFHDLNVPI